MRFGVMAMQLNALIPPEVEPHNILAHIAGFDQSKLVRDMASQGFRLIELGGDLAIFLPHTYMEESIHRLEVVKSELNVGFTQHLPLWSGEPSTPLTQVRQGSVEALIASIEATRSLDPEIYVLHATGALAAEFYRMNLPSAARQLLMRQFQNGARASIKTLLNETGIPSRKLAIETIEFPFDLTLELANELDLSICFDTGHVLAGFSGAEDFFQALEQCLPRLGEIHLHDSPWIPPNQPPGYGKDHQPLGDGDLNVGLLLDRLNAANFDGPIIFELTIDQALASMNVVRSLRPNLVV
jgi:sugar phosphate isomerase/epimerase